jgi:ribosomal protein L11 methyltransferase
MLIAQLSEIGYEGFEEAGDELYAYIPTEIYDETTLTPITSSFGMDYSSEMIPEQNWNELWESNFEPVVIEGLCTIRADFHHIAINTPYEIIITPKMSFGTGHHATTHLMMEAINKLGVKGQNVLDFGTGTGVLAILAEKLGAASITAIDNDEWAVTNALENVTANGCTHIHVSQGSLEQVAYTGFNVILANINRHILLEYMKSLHDKLAPAGTILMSGLLEDDEKIIVEAAANVGLQNKAVTRRNGWIALLFAKA